MQTQWSSIFILFFLLAVSAQSREIPDILAFPKEIYGAQNQNWMLAHLPNQVFAVANSAGLMLFDGNRWSLYPMPDKQIVRTVATNEKGTIFCGGYGSFGYWEGDEFGRLAYHDLGKNFPAFGDAIGEIWNIIVRPDKVIFQSFSEIYIYDYQSVKTIIPDSTIMFITEVNGRLLVPNVQEGIFELNGNDEFILLKGTEALKGKRVAAILPRTAGGYLIGTQKSGFYLYEDEKITAIDHPLNQQLKDNQLNRVLPLKNGNYAFGTILDGIYITDSTTQKLVFHLNKENGLLNNTILSLLEDDSQNLWVGMDKGINYVKLNENLVFYNDESVDIGSVYSAILDQGHLYVATNQGIYYKKMEPILKGYSNTSFRLIPGSQGQVWQLNKVGGQILAGHNLGTFLIENQQIKPISSLVGGWFTTRVPNRPDLLLQATYTGLGLLKKAANGQWQLGRKLDGFSKPLKKILFDEKGNVWGVNPHKGLFLFELDPNFEKIISQRQFTQEDGLPTEFRPDIFKVGEALIIKAGEQFYEWSDNQKKLNPIDSLRQLDFSPGNYRVISFSEQEYFKIFPNYVEWYLDGKKQKLDISLVYNYENILALDENLILFCLDQGYALLNRSKEKPANQKTPIPLISEIKVNGDHSIFPLFQEKKQSWVFAPSEDQLHFFVSLPGLTKNTFLEYRLLGYQKEWQGFSTNLSKEFTNLPPGDYQFQLRIRSKANIQSFSFSILPKWYETNLAKVLYFLLFGVGLGPFFYSRKKE